MKINLNKDLLSLDGKQIKNDSVILTLGNVLANSLISQTKGDPLKYLDWARKLYNGEEIEIDASDMRKLYDFITNNDSMTILTKGSLIEELDLQKEEQKAVK